jgi:anti-sigma factor RsiW
VTCDEIRLLVEAIAAGDRDVDGEIRAHLESCPACAAQLASAQRIEMLLRARPVPAPPDTFTATVVSRIRTERWEHEQHVDRIFNITIAVAIALVVGGVAALTNIDAVVSLAARIGGLLAQTSGRMAAQAAPTVLTYVGAVSLLMSTLVMWWWADRRLSL